MSNIIQYDTLLFTNVWDSAAKFKTDLQASPFANCISATNPDNITLLYYLLYAKYGNNPIANYDEEQWKYKVYSIIFSYGPTWEKRLDIQKKLRNLTEDELLVGSKAIHNSALNPSTEPATSSLEELEYINAQNTTNYKRSKLEAYNMLAGLLATDVTTEFINKFKICFSIVVRPEKPLIYVDEEEE